MTKSEELYACVYAKEFPTQALLRLRPGLRNQPCVVMEGEPPLQSVCSLNAKARVSGATHGMTRVEVETLPAMTTLSRLRNEEIATKAVLLDTAGTFSPWIEDHSSETAVICVVDIAGTQKLFGTADQLGRELFKRIRAIGITASVAVSANVHAAKCLARGMSLRSPVMVVPPGEEDAALAALPLTVLDLTQDQSETFASWGIHTLGMLAVLPERELIARMGQQGKRLRQVANGNLAHFFQPTEPLFTLEEKMELDSPVEILDSLLFVAGLMLEQLVLRATSRALALASVTITLSLEGNGLQIRTVRPALPTNERQLWIKLIHLDLEAHPPPAAILALTLSAEPGSTSKLQLGLFSPQLPEPSRLDVTLARIAKIVGEENVGKAVLLDTHQQQEAFRLERFIVPTPEPSSTAKVQGCSVMRELRPAESVRVMLVAGRLDAILFRQRWYAIARSYGPWRASGEWWNSNLWGCEQWDIVARADDSPLLCCCLARDLMQNLWVMAGLYD
jgi:protein ImuB